MNLPGWLYISKKERTTGQEESSDLPPSVSDQKSVAPPLPPNVSPAFYEMQNYILQRFPVMTAHNRLVLMGVAYFLYCVAKKEEIVYHKVARKRPDDDSAIVDAYKRFAKQSDYDKYIARAQGIISGAAFDIRYRKMKDDLISELKPKLREKFFHALGIHAIVTLAASVVLFLLSFVLLTHEAPDKVRVALYQVGVYLTEHFKPPVQKKIE